MQALARISAPINGRTVFIRLSLVLFFGRFEREERGERICDGSPVPVKRAESNP